MSKRHVEDYFNKVADQYKEMLNELKDFEKECSDGLVEPEIFDNYKKIIEPLKNNYMTWSYVMYLLDLPNREKKVKIVKRRENKSKAPKCSTIKENDEILKSLRNL